MNIPQKNWLEWTVFAIGLALVTSVLGYLSYDAATLGDRPPTIAVQIGVPEQRAEQFVVPIDVTNQGDQAAEGVVVEVVLQNGAGEQQSRFEIAFLPRGATRSGWAAFLTDPRAGGELTARVVGFEKP